MTAGFCDVGDEPMPLNQREICWSDE